MTDILLINPGGRGENYQSLKPLTAIEPPVWCLIIAGYLINKGLSVQILDTNALDMGPTATANYLQTATPKLTVIVCYGHNPSASTQVMPSAGEIATEIKKLNKGYQIAMVGGHVAALPERTMEEESINHVCLDEGLHSLYTLYQQTKTEKCNHTRHMVSGPLVDDLDEFIPRLPWELLPMEKYRAHNWHAFGGDRQPYASIYTTLGCSYNCSYCCIQAPFKASEKISGCKKSYRKWSPEWVIKQIDALQKYGIKNLKIADEMFLYDEKHVNAICDLLIERDYDLNIWAYARVDRLMTPEILAKLKKAGISWLCLGIEAGSEKVRKDVHKNFSQTKIEIAVDMIHDAGIHIIGNYLFGLPEDDSDTMKETLGLAQKLNCEFANFYCTMAYPGSELYDNANPLDLPDSWGAYSQLSKDSKPLPTKHLTGKEVKTFRDIAFRQYFTDPKYLRMIEDKFGFDVSRGVWEMTEVEVERG